MRKVTSSIAMKGQDISGLFGAVFFLGLVGISWLRWSDSGAIYFLLQMFRYGLLACFLATRYRAIAEGSFKDRMISYVSTVLPLCYLSPQFSGSSLLWGAANILAVFGFLLATLATIELGRQFGVSPARRGEPCCTGVYRWFNNPMYTGYAIAEFGMVLVEPMNIGIYLLAICLYCFRGRKERIFRPGSQEKGQVI